MDGYHLIGHFTKPHGFKGFLNTFVFNKINMKGTLFVNIEQTLVPFFVEKCTYKTKNLCIVKLQDVNTQLEAEKFRQKDIFLPEELLVKKDFNTHTQAIEGYSVWDVNLGLVGVVNAVIDYPGHQVLKVFDNSQNEILIPYNDKYVKSLEHDKKLLYVSTPEGLLDLYINS